MNGERCEYLTMEYYAAIKKNENFPFVTIYIELEGIMLSEISQTEKDKYCMISLICVICKTKQTNKPTSENQAHSYREQIAGCQGGRGVEEGKTGEGDQKVQNFSYKINRSR